MDDQLLHYKIIGSGPPLLLVHGWGVSFTIWRELIPFLSRQFQLIIPEMPGIGKSPLPAPGHYYEVCAEALDVLRQKLGIAKWHILGYSLGGWVARNYARRWPQTVDHLMFLCIAKPLPNYALTLQGLMALDRWKPAFGNWVATRWRLPFLVSFLGFNLRPTPLADEWTTEIRSQPLTVVKASLRDIPRHGLAPLRLPPQIPTLFLWGRTDSLGFPPLFPGKRDVILTGSHALPMTGAKAVARVVQKFLGASRPL